MNFNVYDESNDLSDYERLRLENIRKNQEFLAQLGLTNIKVSQEIKEVTDNNNSDEIINKNRKKRKQYKESSNKVDVNQSSSSSSTSSIHEYELLEDKMEVRPLRQSNRLKKIKPIESYNNDDVHDNHNDNNHDNHHEKKDMNITTNDDNIINYDRLPYESDELDDYEFQIFIYLRKWRLNRAKELNIESYKIFQNRTICECIRRKRNDMNWGNINDYHHDDDGDDDNDNRDSGHHDDKNDHIDYNVSLCDDDNMKTDNHNSSTLKTTTATTTMMMIPTNKSSSLSVSLKDINIYNITTTIYKDICRCYNNKVKNDLLLCWGIGPVKVQDDGFAWELIYLLSFDAMILMNFNHSRASYSSFTSSSSIAMGLL